MEFFDYNTYLMTPEEIYDLAEKYENGIGVDKSNFIAVDLYFKAASLGYEQAKNKVVIMKILHGKPFPSYCSIPQEWYDVAISELKEKCANGDSEAPRLLGFA